MSARKKSPLKQLTLNFGQKTAKTNQCKECGMIYNLNDRQDEQLHLKYHLDKEKVLNYNLNSKNEKIVKEYFDGKCIVIQWGIDPKQCLNKAIQVLDFVDSQLGISEPYNNNKKLADFNESLTLFTQSHNIKNLSKFYFFVSSISKKIDGFCLAEPIEHAYKIKYLNENEGIFTYDDSNIERAYCGITRIWVSSNMRRKRIASRLLECVCNNFLYIKKLEPNQIAFSDPTEFGQRLAKSFTKSNEFLIYNNNRKSN